MALRLKRVGITRVRPLQGGLHLWMERQFPVEALEGYRYDILEDPD